MVRTVDNDLRKVTRHVLTAWLAAECNITGSKALQNVAEQRQITKETKNQMALRGCNINKIGLSFPQLYSAMATIPADKCCSCPMSIEVMVEVLRYKVLIVLNGFKSQSSKGVPLARHNNPQQDMHNTDSSPQYIDK
uniref:Uncharacterized protein n=1 Tax=Oryza brachyantha TaxID=4533 RepID=J3LQ11_ORYBR